MTSVSNGESLPPPSTGNQSPDRNCCRADNIAALRARELARLAEIDIREESRNKHYKLGYGRHTQTLALTPSDHRGGQNAAAEMKKKFF